MKTEIIRRPTSGEYEELCFNDTGSVLWVKFTTDDYLEWVAAFGLGENGITKVVEQGCFSLIVAQGQGYLVNRNSKQLILKEKEHPSIKSALATIDPDYIIYSTDVEIKVLKEGIIIKEIAPEWVDGIEILKQEGKELKGQIFEISPNEFWNGMTLNLETFDLTIDLDVKIDYWGILKDKQNK